MTTNNENKNMNGAVSGELISFKETTDIGTMAQDVASILSVCRENELHEQAVALHKKAVAAIAVRDAAAKAVDAAYRASVQSAIPEVVSALSKALAAYPETRTHVLTLSGGGSVSLLDTEGVPSPASYQLSISSGGHSYKSGFDLATGDAPVTLTVSAAGKEYAVANREYVAVKSELDKVRMAIRDVPRMERAARAAVAIASLNGTEQGRELLTRVQEQGKLMLPAVL